MFEIMKITYLSNYERYGVVTIYAPRSHNALISVGMHIVCHKRRSSHNVIMVISEGTLLS